MMSKSNLINDKSVVPKDNNFLGSQNMNELSRPARRCHSLSGDDDFQIVTYKKSKPILTTSDQLVLNSQNAIQISNASTRFPFPPFTIRFNISTISISNFKTEVVNHFNSMHNFSIDIAHCRVSSLKCN